ncbi:hypothetical protein [Sulfurimonas sp. NWX79]|uniref:hypothetical protein n=1 Tax=Sulfurimonas sp. NWX79 TaxID=2925412 RepID=UPI003204D7E6
MTMMLNVDEKYVSKVENFIASLPEGAVELKNSLDDEIAKRVAEYRSSKMQTTPLMDGLQSIREKLVSQL